MNNYLEIDYIQCDTMRQFFIIDPQFQLQKQFIDIHEDF
jgi:hypothetical protein